MATSSSKQSVCARAWLLNAEFDVAEHPQLTNPDSTHIFPEYVKDIFRGLAPYLDHNMKGMSLITFSMQTDLSSFINQGIVHVLGIFHR
jgi:hypothetical protein